MNDGALTDISFFSRKIPPTIFLWGGGGGMKVTIINETCVNFSVDSDEIELNKCNSSFKEERQGAEVNSELVKVLGTREEE